MEGVHVLFVLQSCLFIALLTVFSAFEETLAVHLLYSGSASLVTLQGLFTHLDATTLRSR